jgi:hypothetical protein
MGSRPKKNAEANAIALHVEMKKHATHIVGLGNIRVVVFKEQGSWIAQGLEIDYASAGATKKEAKHNFEIGLAGTVDLHIKIHNGIKNLLRVAPAEIWQAALDKVGTEYSYDQITFHDGLFKALPYEGINFLEPAEAA